MLTLAILLAIAQSHADSAEVIIVTGSADHMEHVMQRANVKYALITPEMLAHTPLNWRQILMVNCTGEMSPEARERVRRFVNAGGLLYTTDHAVQHLLEPIFPGKIKFTGQTTQEEIFPMQTQGDRGLLAKIADGQHEPRWQVAGGGMLFDVLDPSVEILMRSKQVGSRYHSNGVLGVRFRVGDGQVVHVTGHFFTQPGQAPEVARAGQAFEQLSRNVVSEKKDDEARVQKLYNVTAKVDVTLRSEPGTDTPAARGAGGGIAQGKAAAPMRVLQRQGKFVEVRDEQGNEGWVPEDSLR
jgi:hypothetical protein